MTVVRDPQDEAHEPRVTVVKLIIAVRKLSSETKGFPRETHSFIVRRRSAMSSREGLHRATLSSPIAIERRQDQAELFKRAMTSGRARFFGSGRTLLGFALLMMRA